MNFDKFNKLCARLQIVLNKEPESVGAMIFATTETKINSVKLVEISHFNSDTCDFAEITPEELEEKVLDKNTIALESFGNKVSHIAANGKILYC